MPISRINTLAACQCWQNYSSGMPIARRYSFLTIGILLNKIHQQPLFSFGMMLFVFFCANRR
jgi:hypothetical protein